MSSWRLNPWDFRVVSETRRRYGAARIPAGSTVEDWPFGLDELEPYYDKVEYALGVSGQAGNVKGEVDPRGNIFEGPRKRGYPMPPLRGTEWSSGQGHMTIMFPRQVVDTNQQAIDEGFVWAAECVLH